MRWKFIPAFGQYRVEVSGEHSTTVVDREQPKVGSPNCNTVVLIPFQQSVARLPPQWKKFIEDKLLLGFKPKQVTELVVEEASEGATSEQYLDQFGGHAQLLASIQIKSNNMKRGVLLLSPFCSEFRMCLAANNPFKLKYLHELEEYYEGAKIETKDDWLKLGIDQLVVLGHTKVQESKTAGGRVSEVAVVTSRRLFKKIKEADEAWDYTDQKTGEKQGPGIPLMTDGKEITNK